MSNDAERLFSTAQLPPAEQFWHDLHHSARRKSPRVHANVPVSLSPTKGASIPIRSNDLSYRGVQVRCARATAAILRPHSHGEQAQPTYAATLELGFDGLSLRISAHACIAYVTLDPDAPAHAEVAIGMSFVRFKNGAQQTLERFIEHHLLPAGWP